MTRIIRTTIITTTVISLAVFYIININIVYAVGEDTDGDGYTDEQEGILGTDPNNEDTDDDGVTDYQEALLFTDPNTYDTITDDEYASDYDLDNDADGLSNGYELNDGVLGDVQVGNFTGEGGNPNNLDTDEDGLGDLFEDIYKGTCMDITIDNSDHDDMLDPEEDCDDDGLTNDDEETVGTNPTAEDSDSDGFSDGEEFTAGSDPNDLSETPVTINQPEEDVVAEDPAEEETEEETNPDETESDNTDEGNDGIESVTGDQNGNLLVVYQDGSTLLIDAFDTKAKPKVKLTTDQQFIVAVGKAGRKLKVYATDGTLLHKRKLRNHIQQRVKLRVWDFYADETNEIIVATKRNQTLRMTAIQLTASGELRNDNSQQYEPFTYKKFTVKKKKRSVRILHDERMVVQYRVTSAGKLRLDE